MTENVENLILEHLRALRAEIASVKEVTREIKVILNEIVKYLNIQDPQH